MLDVYVVKSIFYFLFLQTLQLASMNCIDVFTATDIIQNITLEEIKLLFLYQNKCVHMYVQKVTSFGRAAFSYSAVHPPFDI